MCIKVKPEPVDYQLSANGFEQCVFCNHETNMWNEETNRPICKVCAAKFDPEDIKKAYFNY